jgi:[CysO sulfur-carrier protein]-S-L-cysteine hydrolase
MPFRMSLPRRIYEEMIAQAVAELPNECCGLLAGQSANGIARVQQRYPLVNELASPIRYLSEPRSLLAAHRDARANNLEFVAVYHSHPTSAPIPSRTDLASNFWEGVIHFIISLEKDPPDMKGWWLSATDYEPADWHFEEEG